MSADRPPRSEARDRERSRDLLPGVEARATGGLERIAGRRLLVCVGPGGVGKTTVAASVALGAALEGRKALVCTIDPARRLGSSLGLKELGNVEVEIPADRLAEAAGGARPRGRLFAMMLDLKRSWDDIVARYSRSPEQRDRIYANRYYRQISNAVAGSREYAAVEKLYELSTDRDYDLIVLDTPPTAHALDFLDAPNRVLDFLDNDAARWLLTPALTAGKVGFQVLGFGSGRIVRGISRFTGLETLRELADFMLSLSGMYEGFKERAAEVKALLGGPQASFLLVTTPQPLAVTEALRFHELLGKDGLHVSTVVANRVHPPAGAPEPAALAAALARVPGLPDDFGPRLSATLHDAQTLWRADQAELSRLRREKIPFVEVLRRDRDVHDVKALAAFAAEMAGAKA